MPMSPWRWQAMQQMHRPHQVHGDDSPVILEHFCKMSDWAAQRPVAEDIVLLVARLWIKRMQIFPAGWLAGQLCQGKVGPQAVQHTDEIPIRKGPFLPNLSTTAKLSRRESGHETESKDNC